MPAAKGRLERRRCEDATGLGDLCLSATRWRTRVRPPCPTVRPTRGKGIHEVDAAWEARMAVLCVEDHRPTVISAQRRSSQSAPSCPCSLARADPARAQEPRHRALQVCVGLALAEVCAHASQSSASRHVALATIAHSRTPCPTRERARRYASGTSRAAASSATKCVADPCLRFPIS